jgi:hypothetical protein
MCPSKLRHLQINLTRRPRNISTPMMLIHRILLVHINLEEPVVRRALVVLEPVSFSALIHPTCPPTTYVFNF